MKTVHLDRESRLFVTAKDEQTFYSRRHEFTDKEAEAVVWLFDLMEKAQGYLVPLLTTHTQPGPFPPELLDAYNAVKGSRRGKKAKATSAKEKA